MIRIVAVLLLVSAASTSHADLLPFDTRWEYPQYITFRPGNGQVSDVNPPRFSWPYAPQVLIGSEGIPVQDFCLQLSKTGDFTKPDLEFRTPYNFFNALPVLDVEKWYWRVGYFMGTEKEQWSVVRSFTFAPDAVEWDRTVINDAAGVLASKTRPRLGPRDGDWSKWRRSLSSPDQQQWLDSLMRDAERAVTEPWWNDFPKSDRIGENPYTDLQWSEIGRKIAATTFAYRLTGDRSFAHAKNLALALASFPRGGQSSPEFHGPTAKWPTQITEYLALSYDWWYADLTPDEREVILDSLDWRLRAAFYEKHSWRHGDKISPQGIGTLAGSHPYENAMWCTPAMLLLAGDLPIADELVGLSLNYLTGVTNSFGPDEAWNEGPSYSQYKAGAMLRATMYTAILLPELHVERNPFYAGLARWFVYQMPFGVDRLPFGDYGATTEQLRAGARNTSRFMAWLTGDGRYTHHWKVLAGEVGEVPTNRQWLELLGSGIFEIPPAEMERSGRAVFPESGWVIASSESPMDKAAADKAVGMVFQCRPRGGYSHSYRCENSFVWYALGETLSAGGGTTVYPDPHSRHSMSHNVVLVNGIGQEWTHHNPAYPFAGRLIAYAEGDGYVHWVGDATHAYQTIPDLLRWHRHVVFVDDKWFVIFDDLAVKPDADPARFSWLFHVAPKIPVEIEGAAFSYKMGDVNARVSLAGDPNDLEIVDMQGRDGFKNPITGADIFEETKVKIASKIAEFTEEHWMGHNLWVTNREPAREWSFLAALTAWKGDIAPRVLFHGDRSVTIAAPSGKKRSISFDPTVKADIVIDVDALLAHTESTDPGTLPAKGRTETVSTDGDTYDVEWLAHETFDDCGWTSRWIPEGDCEVKVQDGRLHVRGIRPGGLNAGTIWYRPELPDNVIVRFRAKVLPPEEGNSANLNLILHARETDGSPVRFGRTGVYSEYHQIPNYIVTLTGGIQPGWSRVRRDPGFNMINEAEVRSEVGREYEIAVTVQNGRIRYYIDGKRWHDVTDPDPLPGGRFAIRTWQTHAWWDDIEFGRLQP